MGIRRPQLDSLAEDQPLWSSGRLEECQEPELVPRKGKWASLSRIQPLYSSLSSWELFQLLLFRPGGFSWFGQFFLLWVMIFHHFELMISHRNHEFFASWVVFAGGPGHPTRPRHLVQRHGTVEWPCRGAKSLLGHGFFWGKGFLVYAGMNKKATITIGIFESQQNPQC